MLEAVRERAGRAYDAVKSIPGKVRVDEQFNDALAAARAQIDVEGFAPDAIDKEVLNRIAMLSSQAEVTPAVLVQQSKRLRAKATSAGARGEREAAGIMRDLASEIDELLERTLPDKKLVSDMQAARQLYAKSFNIQDALEGGKIDARNLGRQSKRRPLSGGLKTAADFAQRHKAAAKPPANDAPGGNVLTDAILGGAGALTTFSVDHPAASGASLLALPLARRASIAALRGIYTRASRQGNKEVAKHAAKLIALRQGGMTGARAQLAKESAEVLYRAGFLSDDDE